MIQVTKQDLLGKPKKVGHTSGGKDVFQVMTKGGLYMMIGANGAPIGTGPHPGVARSVANRMVDGITWTGLSKADYLDPADYIDLLPKYNTMTERLYQLWLASKR